MQLNTKLVYDLLKRFLIWLTKINKCFGYSSYVDQFSIVKKIFKKYVWAKFVKHVFSRLQYNFVNS